MNWETIKHIYQNVLIHKHKIEYLGGDKYKLTGYYFSGTKHWEIEYQNGQLHGKDMGWHKDGIKAWKQEYHNGQLHGKSIYWDEDETKAWEAEYQNGIRIK